MKDETLMENNINVFTKRSKGYSLLLALLPVFMMYKVPVINLGVSTTMIFISAIFAILLIVVNKKLYIVPTVCAFLAYFFYIAFKSNITGVCLCIAIIIHLLVIANGAIDEKSLKKYFEVISCIAAVCVIIQFFIHLFFNVHIPLIRIDWCLDEMEKYRSAITTGIESEGIYRPSAFFLEPSHFAQYASIGLASSLLLGKPNYKKALLISMGIIFTTSGMGIVLVAAIWCAFPFIATNGLDNKKLKRIILLSVIGAAVIVVLLQMPFFQNALKRITVSNTYSSSQYSAIWGRTLYWSTYISPMNGIDLAFGYGAANLPDVYFTGVMSIIYSYGVVGLILFYLALLILFKKANNRCAKLLTVIYAGLLIVANLTNFINTIYYIGYLLCIGSYMHNDGSVMAGQ